MTPIAEQFADQWHVAVGCSGTLLAVEQVLIQQGWLDQGRSQQGLFPQGSFPQGITRAGLEALKTALLAFDSIDGVRFQGLKEDRRSIFATGICIVLALFDSLAIDSMQLSQAGLREGIASRLLRP
ncbi:MAG: hypothetical protein V3T17_18475 [Pseudomonadales bacterium]